MCQQLVVRPFDKVKDREQFNRWNKGHGITAKLDDDTAKYLPDDGGFIVDDLACIFVYQTNTRLAYIDQMMTNPFAPFDLRRRAGILLVEAIMQFAVDKNIHLYSWCTANKAIDYYAQHAGSFQLTKEPHQLWYWINHKFKS